MARRINTTTVETKSENNNELFMNLGFKLKSGEFVRLSSNIVISVDSVLTETKNVNDSSTDWGKKQLIINRAIKELTELFDELNKGESLILSDYETMLNQLTFELRRKGDKAEVREDSYASDKELSELL